MLETSSSSTDPLSQTRRDALMAFWLLVRECHGPLSEDFVASKSHARAMIQRLAYVDTEDAAKVIFLADREGALSLQRATLIKANIAKYIVSLQSINSAESPTVKMDGATWIPTLSWFWRDAVRDHIEPFGVD